MSDAFRSGIITSQDILSTMGPVARAKQQADLTTLGEQISPGAVAARKAGLQAASAQAALATAQANAGVTLTPDELKLKQLQTQQAQAATTYQTSLAKYSQYGYLPLYKTNPETGEPTSERDYYSEAQIGSALSQAEVTMAFANRGLAGTRVQSIGPKNQSVWQVLNADGEDVGPGTPGQKFYSGLRQKAMETLYSRQEPPKPVTSGTPGPHEDITMPIVAPKVSLAPVAGVPPVVTPSVSRAVPATVTDSTGTPVATVSPVDNGSGLVVPSAGAGLIPREPVPGTTLPETITRLGQEQAYSDWQQKIRPMRDFSASVDAYNRPAFPEEKEAGLEVFKQRDDKLVQAIKGLAVGTQNASSRNTPDLQMHEIEESMPKIAAIKNWKGILFGTSKMDQGTRERLIDAGNDYVRGFEQNAKPWIEWAPKNAGTDFESVFPLDSEQGKLHSGISYTREFHPGSESSSKLPATPNLKNDGPSVPVTGGGTVHWDAATQQFVR
jgi:hypothetical protein